MEFSDGVQMDAPPWARRPPWADRLLAQVSQEFAVTAAGHPVWPDPHETGDPEELAYSVCSDPGKYGILDARVEAWARALNRLGLAKVTQQSAPDAGWVGARRSPDQLDSVWVMAPTVREGLTLSFASTLVDGEPFGFDIGVSADDLPVVFLEGVPDCGCDACDHGSQPELDAIDAAVLTIAGGGVVHARDDHRYASATIDGWHTSNHAPESWLDACVPVPDSVRRWLGTPWLEA